MMCDEPTAPLQLPAEETRVLPAVTVWPTRDHDDQTPPIRARYVAPEHEPAFLAGVLRSLRRL